MNLYGIGNSVSQVFTLSGIGRNGAVQSASGNDEKLRRIGSTNVRLSEAGRLQSALSDLKTSASALDSKDKVAKVKAKSDNKDITAVTNRTDVEPKSFDVQVNQLAQSQQLRSQAFADRDSSIVGTGSLQVEFGRFNSSSNSFTPTEGTRRTVSISAGDGTLNGIAKAINRANVGIDAKVVEDNGSFRLDLSGQKTGGDQAFRIRVSDNDGSNQDNSQGLSRLAYDPSEVPGTGRNLDINRNAKFAELTLNGKAIISATNDVSNVDRGISLRLSATGVAKVDLAREVDEASSSARTFVDAVNRFNDQVAGGRSDTQSRKVVGQIDKALSAAQSSGETNRLTLEQVGIERDRQGQLKLDEEKFSKAFAKDAEQVSGLLADAASRVSTSSTTALTNSQRITTLDSTNLLARSDNPYAAQTRIPQFQSRYTEQQPTLLSYSPSTQNLYGLSQYLSIAGL
ncbi:flagellar filament capping protein FliD [Chitinimonas sp. PSY-7]|uniref:flagellar filament capping protein FliD n=1 Tax=Chitinimonas sp. PSY-7 TaxID=3459088 RepID=UPI004040155B